MEVDYSVNPASANGPNDPSAYRPDPQAFALITALQNFTIASDHYAQLVGGNNKMMQRDMYALRAIMQGSLAGESLSPTDLAKAVNLSMPATTALIDRLVKSGHVTRRASETDRRRIVLEATPKAAEDGRRMFMPLAMSLMTVIDRYSPEQIALLTDFTNEAVDAVHRSAEASKVKE